MPATISARVLAPVCFITVAIGGLRAEPSITLQNENYDRSCGVEITQQDSQVSVQWPIDAAAGQAKLTFELGENQPLIRSVEFSKAPNAAMHAIARDLDPLVLIRVGKRDLNLRGGWTIFFDRMQEKPNEMFRGAVSKKQAVASSHARRATLTIGEISAGPFRGTLRWTFYNGSPFVLQEAVVQTSQEGTAYLYDMGLVCREGTPGHLSWRNASGAFQRKSSAEVESAQRLPVRGRAVCAEFDKGSISLFPPPHRYFYPLDFSDNLSNIWIGPNYESQSLPLGFGIRHDWRGDNRFVPWFNAPPGTAQELGLFLLISSESSQKTLDEVARLTRRDHFEPLPGHKVFSSHYHVEHTQVLLDAQGEDGGQDTATGHTPSGGEYQIPARLSNPGFIRVFRDMGIDIVHLAEFHFGRTPRMSQAERLRYLDLLHAECRRLSDDRFLLLPGEEPNVHLGGHWLSFFPQPVHWVLNRPAGTPFVTEHPRLGNVYHVGSEADILRLLRAEGGLAWTAHPRIKGSTGFPDRYRNQLFFQSDRFLGGAWKAMPADLSQPRLGSRVLDLLDDMANWGDPKYVLGEVDVFKIEPDHELYGHMNVNYLRLDHIPAYGDGWQPVLDALRNGQFFVTTGEVLIPRFSVSDQESGQSATIPSEGKAPVHFDLKWTFPLTYAEIISGDGHQINRNRIDLSHTAAFGEGSFTLDADLAGQRWARLEVWDIATNGAFTQPVWLQQAVK